MKSHKKIKHIRIYDVDGTICDSSHRYRTMCTDTGERIDLEHWRKNSFKSFNDTRLPLAVQYEKDIQKKNTFVIIATNRLMKQPDFDWIEKHLGLPDSLVFRTSEEQKGTILKVSGIQRVIQECNLVHVKPENMLVYEDNHSMLKHICDTFKCLGIYTPSNQGH